ncbi:BZ3500_MvSof-1268-A1-R1_Chr7-3g09622 [Microbotryum saponariae]|uniref:BZ3500_MvSof-1268-A1-R1_Chr7-3g09622 protein n=1 Tax=Microbotryum saponariae TaxID=289078 RepID=A0A2X0NAB1_9BASI|nr:BZ3500_MvSof-1268-A1-R1_Chr7-3g09622 [Microbotryum saponariae]
MSSPTQTTHMHMRGSSQSSSSHAPPPPPPSSSRHSHSQSNSHSHSRSGSASLTPSMLASLQSSTPSLTNQANTTRILKLSNFDPSLKTRDIHHLFAEWEDERGGFRIKWADDVTCWIVFTDPVTGAPKRAYLTLLGNPPAALQPTKEHTPSLTPYSGPEANSILAAVANRPRSRSNAGSANGGHSRKGSSMGSGSGFALGAGGPPVPPLPTNIGNGTGFGSRGRSPSFTRSDGQSLPPSSTSPMPAGGMMGSPSRWGNGDSSGGRTTPSGAGAPRASSDGPDTHNPSLNSPNRGGRSSPEVVRRAMETSGGSSSPRHMKAGVEVVANAVEGLTIDEEGASGRAA